MEEYDYKRLRQRILKSWNRETTEEPEKESTVLSSEKQFSKPAYNRTRKEAEVKKPEKRYDKFLSPKENQIPSGMIEKNKYITPLLQNHQSENTIEDIAYKNKERNKRMVEMARDWVVYDAVFNGPRFKHPWKPFRK